MHAAGRQDQIFSPQKSDDLIDVYRRTGRPEDFEQIVRRFAALVLSETRRVTRNSHDAEDASQLAFLALAMEIKSGTNILRVGPWLQRVSRRQALKIVRSRGRRQKREDAVRKSEMHLVDTDSPMDKALAAGIIRDAIDQLPDRYRLPVVLHYFGGMSLEMISAEMKITRQTVGTRLHRGRKMLAARLGKQGVVLDSIGLADAMNVVVPAAVIQAVLHTAHSVQASNEAATLPAAVTQLLRTVSFGAAQKPLRLAAIVVALACSGSGMAWAIRGNWPAELKPARAMEWLQRVLRFSPRWDFHFQSDLSASSEAPPAPIVTNAILLPTSETIAFHPSWAETPIGQIASPVTSANVGVVASHVANGSRDVIVNAAKSAPQATSHVQSSETTLSVPVTNVQANSDRSAAMAVGASTASTSTSSASTKSPDTSAHHDDSPAPAPLVLGSTGEADTDHLAITGGTHRFTNIDVGQSSAAIFDISGGADVVASQIRIGVSPGSSGTVIQQGGHVSIGPMIVGDVGTGEYDLTGGGSVSVGQLTIGNQPQSRGQVRIPSGEFDVANAGGGVTVGGAGNGALIVGSNDSPGAVHAASDASVPVVVRDKPSGQGLILGWGAVGTGGTLVNNGQVVADGYNHVRTLDLTHFSTVENTIDNMPAGDNGWFVQRGGRIALPAIQVTPTVQTYTWGESSNDPQIDLVNSVRLNVYGQSTPATVSLTLRTATPADPLDVGLPPQVTLVGLWQVNAEQFNPALVNYVVRYNVANADFFTADESAVGLYAYNGQWLAANQTVDDSSVHLVSGDFNGSISYLAVGVAYTKTIHFFPINSAVINGVQIPEPAGAALVVLTSMIAMKRRGRRRENSV